MKSLILSLIASTALAQSEPLTTSATGGVSLSTSQTITGAKTFSATLLTTGNLQTTQGQKLTFDGATEAKYLSSDGTTLTLTGLAFTAATSVTTNHLVLTGILDLYNGTTNLRYDSYISNGATAIGHRFNTAATYSTAGANLATFENNTVVGGRIDLNGFYINPVQTLTVADNGDGGTAAASTLTPTSSYVNCTCNDAQGCNITMGETGVQDGTRVTIITSTANSCVYADTSGVSELAGAYTAGQYDSITMIYLSDRWVEVARSNN